tara:strand:+ start:1768 stop:1923 length:156 start_codon:yes stop_codon:yes gene_type:complete
MVKYISIMKKRFCINIKLMLKDIDIKQINTIIALFLLTLPLAIGLLLLVGC